MDAACGSFKYSDAVELSLSPSRSAAAFLALVGIATLAVGSRLPLQDAGHWSLALVVVALTAEALRTVAARRGARAVRTVRLDRWGSLFLGLDGGRVRIGFVRPRCFVAPWLTIVRWRPEGARFDRTFIVLPDMLDAEPFRRLRVLLKWGEISV